MTHKQVILIFPHILTSWQPLYKVRIPLGLYSIATHLKQAGYDVVIINQRLDANWLTLLQEGLDKKPIYVGVSSMTGPQIDHALEISAIVKQFGNTPVVWGGVHPTILPEQTLENELIDMVVQGEGEETCVELAQALEGKMPLNAVNGLWYKENGAIRFTGPRPFINLNALPPFNYDLLDYKKYLVNMFGVNHLNIATSRGCPYQCAFCYNTVFGKRRWRAMTPERVVMQIKELVQRYDIQGLFFSDSNFFVNMERGRQILKGIVQENLNLVISKINIDVKTLIKMTDDDLALLQKAGCRRLPIAIESSSERISALIKKPIDLPKVLELNQRLRHYSIVPDYIFMMGFPTETRKELAQTVAFAFQLMDENPEALQSFNIYTPYPGTELFDLAVQYGFQVPSRLEEWAGLSYRNPSANSPWLTPEMSGIIEMINLCSFFVVNQSRRESYEKMRLFHRVLRGVYTPVAKMRMKRLFYQFPIEVKLAKLLQKHTRYA
jgi:radical SAM superfamily enzyme YgiQ (UPF0313 family)